MLVYVGVSIGVKKVESGVKPCPQNQHSLCNIGNHEGSAGSVKRRIQRLIDGSVSVCGGVC